jgi:hypothetical protein
MVWKDLLDSLDRAVAQLPYAVGIVTESFGSLLAESLYSRLAERGEAERIRAILHSPPVLDLYSALRTILGLGQKEFKRAGDVVRGNALQALIDKLDRDPGLGSPSLHAGIDLAFESAEVLRSYFRTDENFSKWLTGFGIPGCAPESKLRDRILRGMDQVGAPATLTFAPDAPTFVCAGGGDPYQKMSDFEAAIAKTRGMKRRYPVEWHPFAEAAHYPHVDAFPRWRGEVWEPFRKALRDRA